jgi:hypothetical protein
VAGRVYDQEEVLHLTGVTFTQAYPLTLAVAPPHIPDRLCDGWERTPADHTAVNGHGLSLSVDLGHVRSPSRDRRHAPRLDYADGCCHQRRVAHMPCFAAGRIRS